MNTLRSKKLMTMLLIGALAVMAPRWATASTAPCTAVNNMAKISYSVGGTAQNEICSSESGNSTGNGGTSGTTCTAGTNGAGNTSFTVGVKVIASVTNNDSNEVSVVPGTTKYALKFTVANSGNAVQDYDLSTIAAGNGTASPYGGNADSFNGTTIAIYDDTGGTTGSFDGTDADITSSPKLNNVAADGGTKVVYIVYTPSDLAESNLETAVYYLKATSKWIDDSSITYGNTSVTSAQAGGSCAGGTTVDVVAGDVDGDGGGSNDGDKDGSHLDDGAYEVSTATISVTKVYAVYSDPITGTTDGTHTASTWTACSSTCPKAIPGAVVRYKVTISNAGGGSSATLTQISDGLANTLQIASGAGGATWAVTGSTRSTTSGTLTADTLDANADGLGHSDASTVGGTLTATITTILASGGSYAAGELKAGESINLVFGATIQ